MHRLAPLLVLLAACSSEPGEKVEARSWTLGVEDLQRLRIVATDGLVSLSTAGRENVSVQARLGEPEALDVERGEREIVLRLKPGAGPVTLVVTAPQGLDLQVAVGGADVRVRGFWGRVSVGTRDGAVDLDAALAGGSLRTVSGGIDVTLRRSDIEEDLEVRSDAGDLAVRLPAGLHGPVQIGGAKGKIDVVPHRRQSSMVWDPDETNVKGWIGPVPSPADVASPEWEDKPSVLARTKSGGVRFELVD